MNERMKQSGVGKLKLRHRDLGEASSPGRRGGGVQSRGPKSGVGGRDGKTSFHERRLGPGNQVVQCSEGRGLAGGLVRGVRGRSHHWVIDKDIL